MEAKEKKIEFHIKKFMYSLELKKSALVVYAALYSFSVGERGLYHGTQQRLADGLDISLRCLQNTLKKLFSLGLIERYVTADGRYRGIRCVMSVCERGAKREENITEKQEPGAESLPVTEKAASDKRSLPAGAEDRAAKIKVLTTLGRDASEQEKNTFYMMYRYEDPNDHRRFMRFGKEGLVAMTEAQYKRLLDLLPTEELMPYLSKFENMLKENRYNGKRGPHSHYKTLKKWIESDLSL